MLRQNDVELAKEVDVVGPAQASKPIIPRCHVFNQARWRQQQGQTCDRGQRIGYECKLTDSPRMTKSMHVVMADLKLDHLFIVYPGEDRFPLAERVTAIGLADIGRDAV